MKTFVIILGIVVILCGIGKLHDRIYYIEKQLSAISVHVKELHDQLVIHDKEK